jgi:hypothetical protein
VTKDELENQATTGIEKLGYQVDQEIKSRLSSGSGNCEYDERVILSAAVEQITEAVESVDEDVFLVDTENMENLKDKLEKWSDRYS